MTSQVLTRSLWHICATSLTRPILTARNVFSSSLTVSAASWSVGLQWGIFLPAAWLVGPVLGYGLLGIWLAQMGFRLLQALAFVILWQRRGWVTARA